jgi:hypothetical protein
LVKKFSCLLESVEFAHIKYLEVWLQIAANVTLGTVLEIEIHDRKSIIPGVHQGEQCGIDYMDA